jgi:hypothetical protein
MSSPDVLRTSANQHPAARGECQNRYLPGVACIPGHNITQTRFLTTRHSSNRRELNPSLPKWTLTSPRSRLFALEVRAVGFAQALSLRPSRSQVEVPALTIDGDRTASPGQTLVHILCRWKLWTMAKGGQRLSESHRDSNPEFRPLPFPCRSYGGYPTDRAGVMQAWRPLMPLHRGSICLIS